MTVQEIARLTLLDRERLVGKIAGGMGVWQFACRLFNVTGATWTRDAEGSLTPAATIMALVVAMYASALSGVGKGLRWLPNLVIGLSFSSLAVAREKLTAWKKDHNRARSHSSLGNLTSPEFALGGLCIYHQPPVSSKIRQRQETLRRKGGPLSSNVDAALPDFGEIPKGRGAFSPSIRVVALPINQIAAVADPDHTGKWARAGGW